MTSSWLTVIGRSARGTVGAVGDAADFALGDPVGAGALSRGAVLEQAAAPRSLDRRDARARLVAVARARAHVGALRAGVGLATFDLLHWAMDARRATFIDARRIACRVLCVAGAFGRVNLPKTVASIARRYRERGEYFDVANASHFLIGEPGWETTARFVREWVANVTSPVGV